MKLLLLLALVIALGGFFGGIPLYMAGRILCPEVGIPVPPFGACYWVAFWSALFAGAASFLGSWIKDVVD